MPALLKVLGVFCLMLVGSRLGLPLGAAMIAAGAVLGLWAGQGPAEMAHNLGAATASPLLWMFVAVTALVMEIGRYMGEARNTEAVLGALRRWGGRHGRIWTLVATPSVIGLIPMPAGAVFSAPLVEQAAVGSGRSAAWKTAVNYWFRHTWEYWWPLYPAVIVAMSIFHMEPWRFVAAQFWFTPVSVLAGLAFLIRPHREELSLSVAQDGGHGGRVIMLAIPLMMVIVSAVVLPSVVPMWPGWSPENRRMAAMLAGLLGAVAWIAADGWRIGYRVFQTALQRRNLSVLFAVMGVMVFKDMLDRSGLLPVAGQELLRSGIPVLFAVAFLPLVAGLVTGLGVGFVGASLPLVAGLVNMPASNLTPMAALVLGYGFGYVGMMLSPVHLCLVTSREYFEATPGRVYAAIAPCVAAVAVASVLLHLLFRGLGW